MRNGQNTLTKILQLTLHLLTKKRTLKLPLDTEKKHSQNNLLTMGLRKTDQFLVLLLCLQIAFFIYSLFIRNVDIDDAWLGEHAYWLAKEGHARSELMRGWFLQEVRLLIHHKLMTLLGMVFIKFFGFSVYTLKSVSLLYFALFIPLLYSNLQEVIEQEANYNCLFTDIHISLFI